MYWTFLTALDKMLWKKTKKKDQMQHKYQAQSNTGVIVTDFRMMKTLRYDLSYTKEPYKHIVS